MSTAIVTGMIATHASGGVAWTYGQYVLGLDRLGFDVYYLEDTALPSFDPSRGAYVPGAAAGVRFLEDVIHEHLPMLAGRWHVRGADHTTYGMPGAFMADVAEEADVLVNLSGSTLLRPDWAACRRKLLVDTDPRRPYWSDDPDVGFRAHDEFFTYAGLDSGAPWQATRPPVVLDAWAAGPPGEAWTTVQPDAQDTSVTAAEFRDAVRRSRGELRYIDARRGWFSPTTACYLAAGRPAVVQDTGFSERIACGDGLIAFTNGAEARAGVAAVEADLDWHAGAARAVARDQFGSDRVLSELLARARVA